MNGTSFQREAQRLLEHLQEVEYDQVILTRFEDNDLGEEHYDSGLAEYITWVTVYAYGWEKGELPGKEGINWAVSGGHSEIVLIEDWMHDLRKQEVYLCGAFSCECIEDMEVALDAVGVNYQRLNHLIT